MLRNGLGTPFAMFKSTTGRLLPMDIRMRRTLLRYAFMLTTLSPERFKAGVLSSMPLKPPRVKAFAVTGLVAFRVTALAEKDLVTVET